MFLVSGICESTIRYRPPDIICIRSCAMFFESGTCENTGRRLEGGVRARREGARRREEGGIRSFATFLVSGMSENIHLLLPGCTVTIRSFAIFCFPGTCENTHLLLSDCRISFRLAENTIGCRPADVTISSLAMFLASGMH